MYDELEEIEMSFLYFIQKKEDGHYLLDAFFNNKNLGLIAQSIPSGTVYMQKNGDAEYYMDSDDKNVYEKYYEAMKRSVSEKKDYLFDLVKNKKTVLNPNVEY